MPAQPSSQPYFPALNGIRAVAALMVFVHHVELYRLLLRLPSNYLAPYAHPWLEQFGSQGVGIFFVLSGFLITYLLLEEREKRGRIRILPFYARRVLRIWPVYFLMVLAGFFVLPRFGYPPDFHVRPEPYFWIKFGLMVFLLPNVVLSVFGVVFPVAPLWSVGIEEQFYLVWPHVLQRGAKRLPGLLLAFVAGCVAVKIAAECGQVWMPESHPFWKLPFQALFDAVRFDSMALGGLAACGLRQGHAALGFCYRREVQIAALVATLLLYGLNPRLHAFHDLVYGSLYAVLILNAAANPKALLKFSNRILDAVGRVSYGFYVYHTPLLIALLYGLKSHAQAPWFAPALYGAGLAASLGMAALSYRIFESPILALKTRFSPE